jgi:hypothetical protein
LIGFKLGDDLLGVSHLLPCDHVVKIWWQLVLIWPQIGRFFVGEDFSDARFLLIHDSRTVQGYCSGQFGSQALFYAFDCYSVSVLADSPEYFSGQSEAGFQTENRTSPAEFGFLFLNRGQSRGTVADSPGVYCSVFVLADCPEYCSRQFGAGFQTENRTILAEFCFLFLNRGQSKVL